MRRSISEQGIQMGNLRSCSRIRLTYNEGFQMLVRQQQYSLETGKNGGGTNARKYFLISLAAALASGAAISACNAAGGGGGHGTLNTGIQMRAMCARMVREKFCGGVQCHPGRNADVNRCVQNNGRLD